MNSIASHLAASFGKRIIPRVSQVRSFTHHLTPEQKLIQRTCREFAVTELTPVAEQLDRDALFPEEQIKKLGMLGLMAVCVSPAHHGMGLDPLALSVAVEELSRGCAGTGVILSIHNFLYANLLDARGTERQKEQYLNPFVSGQLGCFALSEPNAGSDVAALQTTARRDDDHWVLNGTKAWVTSALQGKAIVVFANVDKTKKHRGITAFIMPMDTPGIILGPRDDLMGIKALSTCTVTLQDVRVHSENIVGRIGEGFKIAMMQLDQARVGIASQAIGISQAALDCAVKYAAKRQAFGKPLTQLSSVQQRLADMWVRLEGARLLTRKAAVELDSGRRATRHCSVAKVAASTCAHYVTDNCVQILGAMGYAKGMAAERHYRDARVTQIYGGVTDVQKMVIAMSLINEYFNQS